MKSFLFFLLSILFFSVPIYSQTIQKYSGLYSYKHNSNSYLNLKDSVKAVYFKFKKPKACLTEEEIEQAYTNNLIRNDSVINFDKFQRITGPAYNKMDYDFSSFEWTLVFQKANDYAKARYKKPKRIIKRYEHLYDNDIAEKSKYKTALKQYYPVWNHNLLLKLDEIQIPAKNKYTLEIDNKTMQNYKKFIYKYVYDSIGRVKEEKKYNVIRTGTTIDKTCTEDDLFIRKLFYYNEKGQVIIQRIIAGPQAQEYRDEDSPHRNEYLTSSPEYFRIEKSPRQFYADIETKCRYYGDLHWRYAYDTLGRITQVKLIDDSSVVAMQDYIYHPDKDYVETVKSYGHDLELTFKNYSRSIKTYNEQGDLIKIEAIPDAPQKFVIRNMVYYYTYEYDKHNNWIKCNMFLEGTDLGEPTLIAERKIEYYK
ncbi:hypothetical protein [Flavobacterium mesophilum]|uniref:hypothetical protein n=1 Tax=Flavobacterium mesophilum TaxID=3143495 RepID=UPI0031E20CDA